MVRSRRVTYRRRHAYHTVSNRTRVVKTPGGKLTVQYVKKKVKVLAVVIVAILLLGYHI